MFAATRQYSSILACRLLFLFYTQQGETEQNFNRRDTLENSPELYDMHFSVFLCVYSCRDCSKQHLPALNFPKIMRNIHERGLTPVRKLQHRHIKYKNHTSNRSFMSSNAEEMKAEDNVFDLITLCLLSCYLHRINHTHAICHLFVFLLEESSGWLPH